jgi:hypothetical protein
MPAPEEVTFIVSNRTDAHGQYQRYNRRFDKHFITVSGAINGHLITVVSSMAHEMIHLRQAVARTETHGVEHNAEFRRIAARVCRYFGFDPKSF